MSGVCRVIAGVSGSLGSFPALRYAADLARSHDGTLIPVLAWMPPGGDLADRHSPSPILRQIWHDAAWQRLWDAFDSAMGGIPAGVRAEPLVLRGVPGRVLLNVASRADDIAANSAAIRGTVFTSSSPASSSTDEPNAASAARVDSGSNAARVIGRDR